MYIEVNISAKLELAVGTLSEGPEDRHEDILVIYPDDETIYFNSFPPSCAGENQDELGEPMIWWVQDGEEHGFHQSEVISITEI